MYFDVNPIREIVGSLPASSRPTRPIVHPRWNTPPKARPVLPPVAQRGSRPRPLSGGVPIGIVLDVARIKLRILLFLPLRIGRLVLVVWVLTGALVLALLFFWSVEPGFCLSSFFWSPMELSGLRLGPIRPVSKHCRPGTHCGEDENPPASLRAGKEPCRTAHPLVPKAEIPVAPLR